MCMEGLVLLGTTGRMSAAGAAKILLLRVLLLCLLACCCSCCTPCVAPRGPASASSLPCSCSSGSSGMADVKAKGLSRPSHTGPAPLGAARKGRQTSTAFGFLTPCTCWVAAPIGSCRGEPVASHEGSTMIATSEAPVGAATGIAVAAGVAAVAAAAAAPAPSAAAATAQVCESLEPWEEGTRGLSLSYNHVPKRHGRLGEESWPSGARPHRSTCPTGAGFRTLQMHPARSRPAAAAADRFR